MWETRLADAVRDARSVLPAGCQEGFARLLRVLSVGDGKFQLLILDCRDQGLRDRLIESVDDYMTAVGGASASLHLSRGSFADFADVERALMVLAQGHRVVHVTGGASWFDAARLESFNIRRDVIAQEVRASLLLWLDRESIGSLARIAVDLWAWRTSVITFEPDSRRLPAAADRDDAAYRCFDIPVARRHRIAVLREAFREDDIPDELRTGLGLELGDLLVEAGEMREAETIYRELLPRAADERSRAIVFGRIADVLQARGDLDEALRIRREEELPVYERLGDVRSRAVTLGRIADVLEARGNLDEGLRIRREEELPVYDRVCDVRSRAVTMGRIADVLQARGDFDEALRIRREEQLPVFEHLGEVRSRAVTLGKIADVLEACGESDEASRIRREEELPVYERLGDARGKSATLQKIAAALLGSDGIGQGRLQEIHDALAEAFAIAIALKAPDGIGSVGIDLAKFLIEQRQVTEARQTLNQAEAAFRKLGNRDGLAAVERLRGRMKQPKAAG